MLPPLDGRRRMRGGHGQGPAGESKDQGPGGGGAAARGALGSVTGAQRHRTYLGRPAFKGRSLKRWGPHLSIRMVTVRAHPRGRALGACNKRGSLLVLVKRQTEEKKKICPGTLSCEMCSSLRVPATTYTSHHSLKEISPPLLEL